MTEVNAGHTHAQMGSREVDANASKDPDHAAGLPSQELASRGGQAGGSDVNAAKASDAHKPVHPAHAPNDGGLAEGTDGAGADHRADATQQRRDAAAHPTGTTAEGDDINRPSNPSRSGSDTASPAPATSGEGAGNAQNKDLAVPPLVRAGQRPIGPGDLRGPGPNTPGATAADIRAAGQHGANPAGTTVLPPAGAQHSQPGDVVESDLDPQELANLNAGIADTKTQRRAIHAQQQRPTTRVQVIPDREFETSYEAWLVGKVRSLQSYQQQLVNQLSQLGVAVADEPYYEDFKG